MITFGHQFDAVLGVKLEGLGDRRPRASMWFAIAQAAARFE